MAELWAGFRACEESDGTTVGASFDCELRSRSGCGEFLCATKNLPHPELVEGRRAEMQAIGLPHAFWRLTAPLSLAKHPHGDPSSAHRYARQRLGACPGS